MSFLDDVQEDVGVGRNVACWPAKETASGVFEEPTTGNTVLLTTDPNPSQEISKTDDEQRRAGSRSAHQPIIGRLGEGTCSFEMYVKPSGTAGTAPMGDLFYEAVLGTKTTGTTTQGIILVNTASCHRMQTSFDVAATTDMNVGDGLRLSSAGGQSLGADGEIRFIESITSGTIVVVPGWSKVPTTSDSVTPCVTYKLSNAFDSSYSVLVRYSDLTQALIGMKMNQLSMTIDGTSPFKVTVEGMFLSRVITGEDVMRSGPDQTTMSDNPPTRDDLTTTDLTFGASYKRLEIGSRINLQEYDSAGATTGTPETKLTVSAVNTSGASINTVAVAARGASPISVLKASNRSFNADTQYPTVEQAGNYNIPVDGHLKMRIDDRSYIEIDLSSIAGSNITAATVFPVINTQLAASNDYGLYRYDADLAPGYLGTDMVRYDSVAEDGAGSLRMRSPAWGNWSRLQVVDSGKSGSMHATLFTGAFTNWGTEIRIDPWDPGVTDIGKPLSNHVGWAVLNGWNYCLTSLQITLNNNLEALGDEKCNTADPTGFSDSSLRSVTGSVEAVFKGRDADRFYDAENQINYSLLCQVGLTLGYSTAIWMPHINIDSVTVSGENRQNISFNITSFADTVDEEEFRMAFG